MRIVAASGIREAPVAVHAHRPGDSRKCVSFRLVPSSRDRRVARASPRSRRAHSYAESGNVQPRRIEIGDSATLVSLGEAATDGVNTRCPWRSSSRDGHHLRANHARARHRACGIALPRHLEVNLVEHAATDRSSTSHRSARARLVHRYRTHTLRVFKHDLIVAAPNTSHGHEVAWLKEPDRELAVIVIVLGDVVVHTDHELARGIRARRSSSEVARLRLCRVGPVEVRSRAAPQGSAAPPLQIQRVARELVVCRCDGVESNPSACACTLLAVARQRAEPQRAATRCLATVSFATPRLLRSATLSPERSAAPSRRPQSRVAPRVRWIAARSAPAPADPHWCPVASCRRTRRDHRARRYAARSRRRARSPLPPSDRSPCPSPTRLPSGSAHARLHSPPPPCSPHPTSPAAIRIHIQ